jgi:DNA-directed RNA polymerase subunit omega
MLETTDTMMNPGIEELLERTGSKFALVAVAAGRARGINTYYSQLGAAMSHGVVPPQVTSTAHKPLSIAFEEIAQDKIEGVGGATGKPIPEALLPREEVEDELVLVEEDSSGDSET